MKKIVVSGIVASMMLGVSALASEPAKEVNTLAYQAIQDGKWSEAESVLRAGLEKNPDDAMRLLNLAYVLQSTGRADEATAVYERVLQLDRDPIVAVGSDSKVRPARAKLLAKKGMAGLTGEK